LSRLRLRLLRFRFLHGRRQEDRLTLFFDPAFALQFRRKRVPALEADVVFLALDLFLQAFFRLPAQVANTHDLLQAGQIPSIHHWNYFPKSTDDGEHRRAGSSIRRTVLNFNHEVGLALPPHPSLTNSLGGGTHFQTAPP